MNFRQPSSRWAIWAFAVALLLKAAVPLLASVSAHVQGKALVEVCTVYGVATVALDGQGSRPAPEHTAGHAGDHCALAGLMALAAPQQPLLALPDVPRGDALQLSHPSRQTPDACAAWAARLKHGPPALA
jgi:hypothetical protein